MKLLDTLKDSLNVKDIKVYPKLYIYTNYQKSHNSITIIISPRTIDNSNYRLEEVYSDAPITDLVIQSHIQSIVSECYARHIRIKIVFNEVK